MPLSAESLHKSGRISDKAMAKLKAQRGATAQKSKMAPFDGKKRDEGQAHGYGDVNFSIDQLNERGVQDKGGRFGTPSKGGRAGGEMTPVKTGQINAGGAQRPKFPAGGRVSASNPKTGNTRMKGKIPPQGGQYGGGGRDTQ